LKHKFVAIFVGLEIKGQIKNILDSKQRNDSKPAQLSLPSPNRKKSFVRFCETLCDFVVGGCFGFKMNCPNEN